VVYDEVLALVNQAATPSIVVRDASGAILLNDLIVPTDFIGDAAGTTVAVPETGRSFWVGARPSESNTDWELIVYDLASAGAVPRTLANGEEDDFNGLEVRFLGMSAVPSVEVERLPGADAPVVAELSKGPQGELLTVGPIAGQALALSPGEAVRLGGHEYTFLGRREFSGITVRRDPGSTLIWVATGVFLLGLALTFYTPRRRLWGKIASGQGAFRGLGGRARAIENEIRQAAEKAATQRPGNA
jgi:hypothetical protein